MISEMQVPNRLAPFEPSNLTGDKTERFPMFSGIVPWVPIRNQRSDGIGRPFRRPASLAGGQQTSRALLQLPDEVQRSQWTPVMGELTMCSASSWAWPAHARTRTIPPRSSGFAHLEIHQAVAYLHCNASGARPQIDSAWSAICA